MGKNKDKATKASSAGGDYGLGAPGSGNGDSFVAADLVGELMLFTPLSMERDVVTSSGTSDAIKADVVVLSGKKPRVIKEGLIFQKILKNQLAEALDNHTRVVGTLFLDEAAKQPGKNAPYKIKAPTEADIETAKAYLDSLDPLR